MNSASEDRWRDLRPDPESDTPLYLQLARKLGSAIHDNRWNAGEALPSERVLSDALGVSRITARKAIAETGRRRLLVSGLLTEACVSFPVLSALAEGYEVFVVADACGGLTTASHELALRRMEAAGARMTSWIQVLLELQRDWTRHETYDGARSIVEAYGGGYGIGLAYARDMIRPG